MLTQVCIGLMGGSIPLPPIAERESHEFDGQLNVLAAANSFPELLSNSLSVWKELAEAREFDTDEVIELITLYYQVHDKDLCELSCYRHFQTEVDKLVLRNWEEIRTDLRVYTKKSPRIKELLKNDAASKGVTPTPILKSTTRTDPDYIEVVINVQNAPAAPAVEAVDVALTSVDPAGSGALEEKGEVGIVKDTRDQLILNGRAGKKIPHTISNRHAHLGMLNEFKPHFANIGARK